MFLTEKLLLFGLFMVLTPLIGAFLAWRTYSFSIRQEKKESPSPVERSNRMLRRRGKPGEASPAPPGRRYGRRTMPPPGRS